jgi:hypothetical protein
LQDELLENAQVLLIALVTGEERELILQAPMDPVTEMPPVYDLRSADGWSRFVWAFETLFAPQGRLLLVRAAPRFERGEFVEILINEAALKREVWTYAGQVALAILLIAALTGAAIYWLLTRLFVRPVLGLTQALEHFRDAPEDASIFAAADDRADEIGRAQHALTDMAGHVRQALRQREHLANLGAAVARIAHDLRNALATAQLVTERLVKSEDPAVRQTAQRLERSIGRAAGLASAALRYGKAEEAAPVLARVRVRAALEDAADEALAGFPALARTIEADADLLAIADVEQLHRILANLIRNAAQSTAAVRPDAPDALRLSAQRRSAAVIITIADHGAGVPAAARAHLFEPFVSSDRKEGAGLGLAIARELARAQGGDVALVSSSDQGATFEVTLPAA